MQIVPFMDMGLRVEMRALLVPPVCLNPAQLRTHLLNLQAQLRAASQTLAMIEMELIRDSDVQLVRSLLPFLRGAEGFFRYAEQRVPEFRTIIQMALSLLAPPPAMPAGNVFYQCGDALRIRSILRRMDQSLVRLLQALRQMESAYDTDAERIYQTVQRRVNAPVEPIPDPNGISAPPRPRTTSIAEQMALASVGRFRREVASDQMLVEQALQEIVSPALARIPSLPIR